MLPTVLFLLFSLKAEPSRFLPFVKYQVEDGLSHNTVWCVLQDSYDFMWFGTSDGLNFFDGRNFRIFRNDSRNEFSLGNNFVRSLFEDKSRNIWVGTSKGIFIFNRKIETFSFFEKKTEDGVLISSNVNKIIESDSGNIWIATSGQGIFIYNPATGLLIQNSIYTSFIWDLLKIPGGDIVATSRQNGLIRFNENGNFIRAYIPSDRENELTSIEIFALGCLKDELWFGVGSDGFYKLDLKTDEVKSVAKKKVHPRS